MNHIQRLTCGFCHRTRIGSAYDPCPCGAGPGSAWVIEWVYEWSWCLDCGASGAACLVQDPCEVCGGVVSALEPGEVKPEGFVKTSVEAIYRMPSKASERCSCCGRAFDE
jgi:hypothetical protein